MTLNDLGLCEPVDALSQASDEFAAPFKPTGKMERCIQSVKENLRKRGGKKINNADLKSVAIAICRSRLKS